MLNNLQGRLLFNESLVNYTSWRIGGPAAVLYIPANVADLQVFIRQLPQNSQINFFGLGSNTLIRDGGLPGITIITRGALIGLTAIAEGLIRAEAGVACGQLARFSARLGWQGLEFMAGIPGTVGGALAMNAGCYGSETWQFVSQVETIDAQANLNLRPSSDFSIAYRHVEPKDSWFVAGYFKLALGDKNISLAKITQLLQQRQQSQPVNLRTCGSVFRNPPNNYAARLIEQCGLKGHKRGNAVVSTKHANFIVNTGQASAADVEYLIKEIQSVVNDQQQISLLTEVCIIGDN